MTKLEGKDQQSNSFFKTFTWEVVYVTIGNPAFCLALNITGVHFRCELQLVGDVSEPEIKYRPIRTREIGGATLSEELYDGDTI